MRIKVLLAVLILGVTVSFLAFKNKARISEVTSGSEQYVVAMMGTCLHDGSTPCYKNVADTFFRKFELPVILEIFEKNEDKQEIFARCHEVTHFLGRQEFQRTKSVPESYQYIPSVCHGGAYHGVIEGYFADKNIPLDDVGAMEVAIKNVCGKKSDYEKESIYNECVHGIGHAMMFITEGELSESLKFCDSLDTRTDQTTCYGGVFMENSSSSTNLDHPSKYVKADDPLYPCNVLEEKYLDTCYMYQSSHFALISQQDWVKVIDLCLSVNEKYRNGCFMVMGSNQVGLTQDMSTRKNNCDLISEVSYRNICYSGIINALVGRYNRDFASIVTFCTILADEDKASCYDQVSRQLLGWLESPQILQEKCRTITEEKYIPVCLKASGV